MTSSEGEASRATPSSAPNSRAAKSIADRPLRILCCSGSFDGGGSERQLWNLVRGLDRAKFLPTVYLLYQRGSFCDQLPPDVEIEAFWNHFDESRRYWPGAIHRLQVQHMVKVIRERQIDLVFDRTFHMTLITGPAARRAGVPRVSVIASPPSSDFQSSRERFRFFKKRLLAAAYRDRNCRTLAVSEETAADAAKFYNIPADCIQGIASPIDIDAIRAAAEQAIGDRPATSALSAGSARPFRVAVVGRLSHEKGQSLALRGLRLAINKATSFQLLPPLAMDIVGTGPDLAALEALTRELELTDHVTFHGFQSNPYPLIRAADLLCIPSKYEGLPNVALEAMGLGTSLLATRCSGSVEKLIGDNERGVIVPVGDAERLSDAIVDRLVNPDAWRVRTQAAIGWIEAHHAFAPWIERMQNLFSSLAIR